MKEANSPLRNEPQEYNQKGGNEVEDRNMLGLSILKVIKDLKRSAREQAVPTVASVAPLFSHLKQALADAPKEDSALRALLLRCTRRALATPTHAQLARAQGLEVWAIQGVERPATELWERLQGMKLIKTFVGHATVQEDVSILMVRSLSSIAEQSDDNFRRVALEILLEVGERFPLRLVQGGGAAPLLQAAVDPTVVGLTNRIVDWLTVMLDDPTTRSLFYPLCDLQLLLSPFTDVEEEKEDSMTAEKRNAGHAVVARLSRTWPGLILLGCDADGLKCLFSLLADSTTDIGRRRDLLLSVTDVCAPLSLALHKKRKCTDRSLKTDKPTSPTLLQLHCCFLVMTLVHCGAIECLTAVGRAVEEDLRVPATQLLRDMMTFIGQYFPEDRGESMLGMGTLVQGACSFEDTPGAAALIMSLTEQIPEINLTIDANEDQERKRCPGAASLGEVAMCARLPGLLQFSGMSSPPVTITYEQSRPTEGSQFSVVSGHSLMSDGTEGFSERYSRNPSITAAGGGRGGASLPNSPIEVRRHNLPLMLEELNFAVVAGMERSVVENQMGYSLVLASRDVQMWRWSVIEDIVTGSLVHPQRLGEALRTKFIHRVSGFFRCNMSIGSFSQLPWTPQNLQFVRVACHLYANLVSHPEGKGFMQVNHRGRIFQQIVSELEMALGSNALSSVFTKQACMTTMASEYFTLIGHMSSFHDGRLFLKDIGLVQVLCKLAPRTDLEHLSIKILTCLDCATPNTFMREVIQLLTTNGTRSVRLAAVCQLDLLLQSNRLALEGWAFDTLATQLHFPEDTAIVQASCRAIIAAVWQASDADLVALVPKIPDLITVPKAEDILIRFVSTTEGLEMLKQVGWLDTNVKKWWDRRYLAYEHLMRSRLLRLWRPASSTGLLRKPKPLDRGNSERSVITNLTVSFDEDRIEENIACWGLGLKDSDPQEVPNTILGMVSLPWNAKIIVSRGRSYRELELESNVYCDASTFRSSKIWVRAEVSVGGVSSPQPVEPHLVLRAALFAGSCPVTPLGNLATPQQTSEGEHKKPLPSAGICWSTASVSSDPENKDQAFWSTCYPHQRQQQAYDVTDQHTNVSEERNVQEIIVTSPGEPVRWIFTRQRSNERVPSSKIFRGSVVFLKAVEFGIALDQDTEMESMSFPPHLYGELASTAEGCYVLCQHGILQRIFSIFTSINKDDSFKSQASSNGSGGSSVNIEGTPAAEKRAALWAMGQIGRSKQGLSILRRTEPTFIEKLVHMTETAQCISLRGIGFCVLSLISSTGTGRKLLNHFGWRCNRRVCMMNLPTLAIPPANDKIFQMNFDHPNAADIQTSAESIFSIPDDLPQGEESITILETLAKLICPITTKQAQDRLSRLKNDTTKRHLFHSDFICQRSINMLEHYSFSLSSRRFLWTIFDAADFCNILENTESGVS